MIIIVKHVFFEKTSFSVITIVTNCVKNYVGWCSQSTKMFDFGANYKDIPISLFSGREFILGLSVSKMICFRVISVEDDLFLGCKR